MYLYRFRTFQEQKNPNNASWTSCWFSNCCRWQDLSYSIPIQDQILSVSRHIFKIKFLDLIWFHLVKRSIIISRYFQDLVNFEVRDSGSANANRQSNLKLIKLTKVNNDLYYQFMVKWIFIIGIIVYIIVCWGLGFVFQLGFLNFNGKLPGWIA